MIRLYDSIEPSTIPSDAQAVAGYVGGAWPDFSALVAKFPNALHKSVAVNAGEDADILDIERGDATPDQAPDWLKRQLARGVKLPGCYANASTMPAVIAALTAAGIDRSSYVLWVADWDGVAQLTPSFQAKQYTDHGPNGENYDMSVADPSFWSAPSPPAQNRVTYDWFPTGPFPSKWGNLNERQVVEQYDGARQHPVKYALYLKFVLRPKLQFLADRVASMAIKQQPLANGKPSWSVDHRGWRFQQLVHRAQGVRFV